MTIYSLPTAVAVDTLPARSVVALGFFDGVHLGHRAIIDTARREAEERGVSVAVWLIASGDPDFKRGTSQLTSDSEKLSLLHSAGAAYAAVSSFSEIRNLDGDSFVRDILRAALDASCVVCGFNFRFGSGASCDVSALRRMCGEQGIDTLACPAVSDESGEVISSTRIRAHLGAGEVKSAALLLGRPYSFTSEVVRGKMLGRSLGFPTANQVLPEGRLALPRGVYAVSVEFTSDGTRRVYPGAANIGYCPTVTDDKLAREGLRPVDTSSPGSAAPTRAVCETYVVGYSGDLYGKCVTLHFLERLRGEMQFESIGELKSQIGRDADTATQIHNEIYGKTKNDEF